MYTLKPNMKPIPKDKDGKKNKANIKSDCDHTMIGFVQDTNIVSSMTQHHLTCFYAKKDPKNLYEKQVAAQISKSTNNS